MKISEMLVTTQKRKNILLKIFINSIQGHPNFQKISFFDLCSELHV